MKKISVILFFLLFSAWDGTAQITVTRMNNRAEVLMASLNEKSWRTAELNMILNSQDRIRTGKNSTLTLKSLSYEVIVYDKSTVILDDILENHITVKVMNGNLRVSSHTLDKKEELIVKTGNSQVIPAGSDFVVNYTTRDTTSLYVFDGKVNIANLEMAQNMTQVDAYKMTSVVAGDPPLPVSDIPENILQQYNVAAKPQLIQPKIEEPKPREPVITPVPEPEKKAEEPKEPEKPKEELKKEEPPKEEPKKEEPKKEEPKPEEKKEPWCKDPRLKFSFNMDMQYMEFNNIGHFSLALMPEFSYCRIGVGLYLPVYYDYRYNFLKPRKSWYNYNEWDFMGFNDSIHDLWIKFLYIRYGQKGDPLYIRIGGLNSVTFGNGFIMYDYSNMVYFPKVRKLGLQLDYTYEKIMGVETMFNDLNRLNLYGGRFLIYPLFFQPDLALLNKLQLGTTMVYDRLDSENKVINWGLDLGLPLVESDLFNLRYGIDWATFSVYSPLSLETQNWEGSDNWGFATGFRGNLSFLKYRAEYRYLLDGYIPEYFDSFYEIQRSQKFLGLLAMYQDPSPGSLNGYLVMTGVGIGGAGEIGAVFQEYYDEHNRASNKAKVYLTLSKGIIPMFYGTASYNKINVVGMTGPRSLFGRLYDQNTMLVFDGAIRIMPFFFLKIYYQRTFQYDSSGKLQSYETYSTGFSIGF
ncbi:MAG: FecR family protein [bacterium]|nr:FecR family protein [bacterium]